MQHRLFFFKSDGQKDHDDLDGRLYGDSLWVAFEVQVKVEHLPVGLRYYIERDQNHNAQGRQTCLQPELRSPAHLAAVVVVESLVKFDLEVKVLIESLATVENGS